LLTTSFVPPHCGPDELSLLNLPLAVYNPDDVERLESSHVEQIRRSGRLGRGCYVGGVCVGANRDQGCRAASFVCSIAIQSALALGSIRSAMERALLYAAALSWSR
jgi:hypothetical protein